MMNEDENFKRIMNYKDLSCWGEVSVSPYLRLGSRVKPYIEREMFSSVTSSIYFFM